MIDLSRLFVISYYIPMIAICLGFPLVDAYMIYHYGYMRSTKVKIAIIIGDICMLLLAVWGATLFYFASTV
jgi:hypothetical protein